MGHLISAHATGVVIGAPLLMAISGNFGPKKILLALIGIAFAWMLWRLQRGRYSVAMR